MVMYSICSLQTTDCVEAVNMPAITIPVTPWPQSTQMDTSILTPSLASLSPTLPMECLKRPPLPESNLPYRMPTWICSYNPMSYRRLDLYTILRIHLWHPAVGTPISPQPLKVQSNNTYLTQTPPTRLAPPLTTHFLHLPVVILQTLGRTRTRCPAHGWYCPTTITPWIRPILRGMIAEGATHLLLSYQTPMLRQPMGDPMLHKEIRWKIWRLDQESFQTKMASQIETGRWATEMLTAASLMMTEVSTLRWNMLMLTVSLIHHQAGRESGLTLVLSLVHKQISLSSTLGDLDISDWRCRRSDALGRRIAGERCWYFNSEPSSTSEEDVSIDRHGTTESGSV